MQRLLKALGYLSVYDRPRDVDEQIQMHADELYHRMLGQEAAIEKAKAEGRPVPAFAPLLGGSKAGATPGAESSTGPKEDEKRFDVDVSQLDAQKQKKWMERLEKVPEVDRQAEEEAMKAELRVQAEMKAKVQSLWEEGKKKKAQQQGGDGGGGGSGRTVGDVVAQWFSGSSSSSAGKS